MLFNSLGFAVFLPIVFGLYWWLGGRKKGRQKQNIFLLLASYLFYGWWDARFLILIFISSLADFLLARAMDRRHDRQARKPFLYLSLLVNLGMLGFFKYFNFFTHNLIEAFAGIGITLHAPSLEVILPVGISFYTFQTLSYTLDVYRGKLEPSRDPVAFFTFVAFFPQLVAGPIEKARDLLPQFTTHRRFSYPMAVSGLRLILYGILKKVLIADRLAEYVDQVYRAPTDHPGWSALLAGVLFTIQIYCDFSGYSDIALGTGRLLGFRLSVNFRTPLFSVSVAEFWRRWHISLNAWFRDYVYEPLGGRNKGPLRGYFNVVAVFLISGIWHGAGWTFIFWGLICAMAYMLEDIAGWKGRSRSPVFRSLGWLWTMATVVLTFIFFRVASISDARTLISSLDQLFSAPQSLFYSFDSELNTFLPDAWEGWFLLGLLGLFFSVEGAIGKGSLDEVLDRWPRAARWAFYYVAIAILLLFGAYGTPQQFIYFQF